MSETKSPSGWGGAVAFVFVGVLILVFVAQCMGAMPPSKEDKCVADGGVWEYKIHKCMNPEVYKEF